MNRQMRLGQLAERVLEDAWDDPEAAWHAAALLEEGGFEELASRARERAEDLEGIPRLALTGNLPRQP